MIKHFRKSWFDTDHLIDGSTARRCIAIVTNERRASYVIPLARNEEFSKIAVINFFLQFSKKTSYLWGGFCGENVEIYQLPRKSTV